MAHLPPGLSLHIVHQPCHPLPSVTFNHKPSSLVTLLIGCFFSRALTTRLSTSKAARMWWQMQYLSALISKSLHYPLCPNPANSKHRYGNNLSTTQTSDPFSTPFKAPWSNPASLPPSSSTIPS